MLGIVRHTDRRGLRGGPRRDQSRLDPPDSTLPRSPQPGVLKSWGLPSSKGGFKTCIIVAAFTLLEKGGQGGVEKA